MYRGIRISPASFAEAIGCKLKISCDDPDNQEPIIDVKNSFIIEGMIGILYIAAISFIQDQLIIRN